MGIEIEKKYRLTRQQRERLLRRLQEINAVKLGEEFEENILFAGGDLHERNCVLRLRRVGDSAILTYKERFPSSSSIKRQREDETRIEDPEAMLDILDGLGFTPALVYEKRRSTWRVCDTEVAVDELPFGFFAEIEGEEEKIKEAEQLLNLSKAKAELATYPSLTRRFGKERDGLIEARFK
ncbi:MAG TPA: class IV adenylate cyclase [Pyrinomonadaceae bacterium]|nr:class IV adenylate cyclase [Pyrinomonadaceae bacterium]